MKKLLLFIIFSAFSAGIIKAQCVPTCSNYLVSQISYAPYPAAGVNCVPLFTPNSDDGYVYPVNIGFNFNFYCSTYSTVLVYSNGIIQFDINAPSTFPFGYDAAQMFGTTTAPPNALVAWRMDDLDPTIGGMVTYTTLGVSPNQSFVVTYSNVPIFGQATNLQSGQIVLHETSNYIDIISILTTSVSGNAATQGIENATGTMGVAVPGRNASSSWTANGDAYRFTPVGPAPPSAISGTTSTCEGLVNTYSINTSSGASTYNWSLPAGWLGTSTLTSISPTAGVSGQLSVSATYTCGTSSPVTISVTVIPSPVVSITSASPAIFCSGPTVTFQTSGASSYTLQPGNYVGTPPFFDTPLTTTQYTLTGTNSSGCISKLPATTNITVKQTPTVTVNSGAVCLGSTFQFTATGANTYVYSTTFPQVTPTVSGTFTYGVVGTATNGCASNTVISTVTVNALPTISVSITRTAICVKQTSTLTASGASTYTWDLSTPSASNAAITVTPNATTLYSVTATDANGCVNSQTASVKVSLCTGITEQTGVATLQIFPNPSKGIWTIKISEAAELSIYDALGRLVHTAKLTEGENQVLRPDLIAGTYLFKIRTDQLTEIKRVIVE